MILQTKEKKRLRIRYIAVFAFFIIIEVIIALFVHDNFVRPYVGDILVVIVLYAFVRIIEPVKCRLLSLYIFLFAAGVEFLQYFEFVKKLGLENNVFLRVLIGSVFDVKDIMCYAIGCMLLGMRTRRVKIAWRNQMQEFEDSFFSLNFHKRKEDAPAKNNRASSMVLHIYNKL